MIRNITQEKLIRFVYGELSFAETAELYDKVDEDIENLKALEEYASLKFEFDKLIMKPSKGFEKRIMAYSASLS